MKLRCLILLVSSCTLMYASPVHPLAALSADEITKVSACIKSSSRCPKGIRFVSIALAEPDKTVLRGFEKNGVYPARKAAVVLLDRAANKVIEALVDVKASAVIRWEEIANAQPMVLLEEYELVSNIVKADSSWVNAIKRRGITKLDDVVIDAWAAGNVQIPGNEGARLLRAVAYLRETQNNFYGRPIEGVTAIVNLNSGKLVKLVESSPAPLGGKSIELFDQLNKSKASRSTPATTPITSKPYKLNSLNQENEVQWQNWSFRFMLHPREGLVLHQVRYNDHGRNRQVIHRISLSEMVVPYGDTSSNWTWRNAFDVGEYGIGNLTFPMDTVSDAPAYSSFVGATLSDNDGKPVYRKNVIAVYERDAGLLWKHYEQYSEVNQSRRARELVVTSIATVGNYDYAVNYIFRQDGGLETEVNLTGIMLPKGVTESTLVPHEQSTAHFVAPHVAAPNHQHFFSFRIDFDVDGASNSLAEIDTWSPPAGSRENPAGNAIVMDEHQLKYEREASRELNLERARKWRVYNPDNINSLGYNSGFVLLPGENSIVYLDPSNSVRKRASFVDHHIWATHYKPNELYAAGDYPNQSRGGDGLAAFIADNESLERSDLVLWYTMGITHTPRPEEYPIMTVYKAGFKLFPAGFFERNPALEVK